MRVLVTGSDGFIGKNMVVHLNELEGFESLKFTRQDSIEKLKILVSQADAIIHLAGENRTKNKAGFEKVNVDLSKILCDTIKDNGKKIKLIFASSIQADLLRDRPLTQRGRPCTTVEVRPSPPSWGNPDPSLCEHSEGCLSFALRIG